MVLMRSIYCYTDCFHRNSHKLCNFYGNSQHIQNKWVCFKCHIINCFTALSPYCHNQGLIFPSMALVLSYKKLISKMLHRFQSSTSIFFQSTGSNPQYGNSQHIQNKWVCFKCHIINCFTALSPYCHNQGLIFPSMALVLS